MERKSWWKAVVAVAVVLLGLGVTFLIVPSGGSNVSATEPARHLDFGNGPDPTTMVGFVKYEGAKGEAENTVSPDPLDWIECFR